MDQADAVRRWQAVFEPSLVDRNFRDLWQQWPSISISSDGPVWDIPEGAEMPLPETFTVGRKTLETQAHLTRMRMSGLAVLHDGKLVFESYGRGRTPQDVSILWSVSKAVTALLVGIAHAEGAIPDLDAPVTDYVPELEGTGYDGVTIQQVADMLSGIRWNEVYDDPESEVVRSITSFMLGSQDEFARTIVRERTPGTFSQYASVETHVLGWVLRRATGEPMADFLKTRLWDRIGAEADMQVLIDKTGEPVVFGGMFMRLRDLLRVGAMIQRGGLAPDGSRILPEKWLRSMAVPDVKPLMPGIGPPHAESEYGYKNQWWIPSRPDGGDFSAIGIFGQFLYINPDRNVVIAMNSAYSDYNTDGPMRTLETLCLFQQISQGLSDG